MFIERCQSISSIQLEIMRNGGKCQFWKGITGWGVNWTAA